MAIHRAPVRATLAWYQRHRPCGTGVQAFSSRGARHVTPAGHVFIVNPGEPHTGEAVTQDGYVYRTVYPRPGLMQQIAADVTVRAALPFFTRAVFHDERLSQRLVRFHRAIADGAPSLSVESQRIDALVHLIRRYPTIGARARAG